MSAEPDAGQWVAPVISLAGARASRSAHTGDTGRAGASDSAPSADDADAFPEQARADAERISMRVLGRRGVSRLELIDALIERDIARELAEAEADRLERVGLIDDTELSRVLVDRLVSRKKLGRGALKAELQRRRLDPEAVDTALTEHAEEVDTDELIAELVADRARRLGALDRATAERRLLSYLQRKGHGGPAAHRAVRAALDGAPAGRRTPQFE